MYTVHLHNLVCYVLWNFKNHHKDSVYLLYLYEVWDAALMVYL
jgi:hypothetical protein